MAKRKKKGPGFGAFVLLLLLVAAALVALHPPARERALMAWDELRELVAPTPLQPAPPTSAPAESRGADTASWSPGRYDQSSTFAGLPASNGYPNSITVLTNTAFVVGYDEVTHNPAWAAYRISARKLDGQFPRPARFSVDNRTNSRVRHEDYSGSGFDRGHMVPNYAIASRFGADAQRETFLMSNVVPQSPALNQGSWRLLEETLADHTAVSCENVWVVVGPIYRAAPKNLRSGVRIPDAFFCLVADEDAGRPRLQAFILPQDTPRKARFQDYLTTVDAVESAAGLDYFRDLPDDLEDKLESAAPHYWLE